MRKTLWITITMLVAGLSGSIAADAAESKPIQDLPSDLATWSTLWMELPKQMYGVGQSDGPVSALTWGPIQGTVKMVDVTAKTLWDMAKENSKTGRAGLLRYEF